MGGVQRLAERAGPSRAREIIYTTDQYDACGVRAMDIVNRVISHQALDSDTRSFVERLARGPTLANAAGKKIVRAYLEGGTREADRVVDEIAPALFETADLRAESTACSNTDLGDFAKRSFSTAANSRSG